MSLRQLPQQPSFPALEHEIMEFWAQDKTFEKSVQQRDAKKSYVFYDGPPFATGLPHYGHLLGSTSKDVIPRYWTMKGYRVERVWGWDCHGLPIENMIEGQLGIKGGKKGIEDLGIDKFNAACRTEVLRLDSEWEKIIARLGRWVDFQHNYKTMDNSYMESVWWGFKQLYDKELVYQGRKVVMYCARCATPLSNFEIAMDNSYADTQDYSLYVAFKKKGSGDEYFLAWTTTPWTLPGNMALAVHPDAEYSLVEADNKKYWLASERVTAVFSNKEHTVLQTAPAQELVGQAYEPLFEYVPRETDPENKVNWTVLSADFVSLSDGTGLVHTAALFGEDDYQLALDTGLSLVPTLDENGKFLPFVIDFDGMFFKKAEAPIVADLDLRGLVFAVSKETHSYPFCYRCNTPLYYNAVPAWFINVQKLKPDLIEQNKHMNWYPDHLKEGRFGKGLETAPDWNISRSRYWGTPMPVWRSQDEAHTRIIGSREELAKWAVDPSQVEQLTDLHREFLDKLEVWVDDAKTVKGTRVPEVFDCWVESGSMPFASIHYPFENKEQFEASYPAQFVSEYIAQTRAWFYTMHVMSVGIFGKHAVDNTLTTGTILAADGSKMSKSKKNYPDPIKIIEEFGVDSLRLYLMSSPVMKAENLNFNEKEVAEIRKKVFVIWWNMLSFYKLYAPTATVDWKKTPQSTHVMDRWVLSTLATLTQTVTESMDEYNVVKASRELMEFVTQLSTWYVRRSRDRFKDESTRAEAAEVLGFVLVRLAQLFAPFTPFFSELLFHALCDKDSSIHLTDWPTVDESLRDEELETQMNTIREVCEKAHGERKNLQIKVKQPLQKVTVISTQGQPAADVLEVLCEEINVKAAEWKRGTEVLNVTLDTELTPELVHEGKARELIRSIQALRKEKGLGLTDKAVVQVPEIPEGFKESIESKTNSTLQLGDELSISS